MRIKKMLGLGAAAMLLFGGAAGAQAATLVQKNAYAYDIRVNASTPLKPVVTYKLNGTAKNVKVETWLNGVKVQETAGTANQSNSVTVDLTGIKTGTVTFRVYAETATTTTAIRNIQEGKRIYSTLSGTTDICDMVKYGYRMYRPLGFAINKCPDSKTFGQMIVSEGGTGTNAGYHSGTSGQGRGMMFYAFDPQFEGVANSQASGKYGFNANLPIVDYLYNRIKISEDGRLFLYTYSGTAGQQGIYEINNESESASSGDMLNSAATKVYTTSTNFSGQDAVTGFDLVGTGANLKVAFADNIGITAGTSGKQPLKQFKLGTNKTFSGTASVIDNASAAPLNKAIRPQFPNLSWDPDGNGLTFIGYASTPSATDQTIIHYNMAGPTPTINRQFAAAAQPDFSKVRIMAYNKDRTLLAVNSDYTVIVYKVAWGQAGAVPSYTEVVRSNLAPATSGQFIACMDFDYANNLYIGNRKSEYVAGFQLPAAVAGSSQTTPAPSSQAFERTVTVAKPAAQVSRNGNIITLNWSAPAVTNDVLDRYLIYYLAPGASSWTTLVDGISADATSYNYTAPDFGEYKFMVCAIAKNGVATNSDHLTINIPQANVVRNVSGTSAWSKDGKSQTATLRWDAVENATAYNIYYAGNQVGTSAVNTATVALPMEGRDVATAAAGANIYTVKAVVNGSEGEAGACTVYHQPFGVITPEAVQTTDASANLKVRWNIPFPGEVDFYNLYIYPQTWDATAKTWKDGTKLAIDKITDASVTEFEIPESAGNTYRFYVNAGMKTYVQTAADTRVNNTKSADRSVMVTARRAPRITELKCYDGRNTVMLKWILQPGQTGQGVTAISHYRVLRDGIVVVEKADYQSCNDMQVPDGPHSYVVIAVYKDGVEIASDPANLSKAVERDQAITQYGLEEIYNYPIMTPAQAAADGYTSSTALIVDPNSAYIKAAGLQNMLLNDGSYGKPGGLYRHGTYSNGKWYIAQLSNKAETDAGTNNVLYNVSTADDDKYSGGVIEFDANNLLGVNPVAAPELRNRHFTAQWLVVDQGGMSTSGNSNIATFLWRGVPASTATAGTSSSNYLFYLGTQYVNTRRISAADAWQALKEVNVPQTYAFHNATNQIGRVHYASASGKMNADAGGYLYMALNRLPKMVRASISKGALTDVGEQVFTLPDNLGPERAADGTISSTENYAFPVAGRANDFIWEVRSHGYFYVKNAQTPETAEYKQILGDKDALNAGGHTFVYNNELFFIHPSSIHSNNTGHFIIDMAKRDNESADISTADLGTLIPAASFTQKALTTDEAGNINGQWYGTEVDTENNCVYIYHFVPGKRFAKYRFYSYEDYPAVQPEIKVTVKHDDEDAPAEITHFDINVKWQRPAKYASVNYKDFKIDHYEVELLDADKNVLAKQNVKDTGAAANAGETVEYSLPTYMANAGGEKHVDWQTYSTRVTPVYVALNGDRTIVGETGTAQHATNYEGNIGEPRAKGFVDPSGDRNFYRVDIDFDRAEFDRYPEPVSYFTVEYKRPGDVHWQAIPTMYLHHGGQRYASEDNTESDLEKHNGRVPGHYIFGNENSRPNVPKRAAAMDAESDKMYALYKHEADAFPCVVFHTTYDDPTDNSYRVTAHYAAENPYIAKSYSKTTTVGSDFTVTGIEDIQANGKTEGTFKVYPNPTHGVVTVSGDSAIESLQVYSISGALAKSLSGNGDAVQSLDLGDLPAGVYMVRVNRTAPVRVVKK